MERQGKSKEWVRRGTERRHREIEVEKNRDVVFQRQTNIVKRKKWTTTSRNCP